MRLVPISRDLHHGKFLRPLSSFAHIAGKAATEVMMGEIAQVAACYPVLFVRQGEDYKAIALLGLTQGENLYVDATGKWTGLYLPATLRAYPFSMARNDQTNELAVLFDEDLGLLSDHDGEPLFGTDDGDPNGPVARAIQLLTQIAADDARTSALVKQLDDYGLLKATSLRVDRQGTQQDLGGAVVVDEAALGTLPDESFLALRRSGALALAYAQILSAGQLGRLQAKAGLRDGGKGSAGLS